MYSINTLPETALAYLHSVSVGAKRTSPGRSAPSRSGTNPYAGQSLQSGSTNAADVSFRVFIAMRLIFRLAGLR